MWGYVADRTWTPIGKYGPYILLGAPACALSFWFLFQDSDVRSENAFVTVLLTGLLFRTAYTVCDVPHNAMMARIADDAADASLISGLRFAFSSAGSLLVALAIGWVLSPDIVSTSARISMVTTAAGALYVSTLWLAWAAVQQIDRARPSPSRTVPLRRAVRLMFGNPALVLLLLVAVAQAASLPAFAKGITYLAKYSYDDAAWSGVALVWVTAAQAISMPLWVWVARCLSKHLALRCTYVVLVAGLGVFATINSNQAISWLWLALIGVGLGGANMILWAMLPDAINAGAADDGARVEALPTGLFLLALKVGVGGECCCDGPRTSMDRP